MNEDKEKQRRYLQGAALAVALHLGCGLLLGLVPIQANAGKQQIIELTLAAPAPKAAAVQQSVAVPPPLPWQERE